MVAAVVSVLFLRRHTTPAERVCRGRRIGILSGLLPGRRKHGRPLLPGQWCTRTKQGHRGAVHEGQRIGVLRLHAGKLGLLLLLKQRRALLLLLHLRWLLLGKILRQSGRPAESATEE